MDDLAARVEEARSLLRSGREAAAVQLLRTTFEATEDVDVLTELHALAKEAHDTLGGFHKLQWRKLMVESEQRLGEVQHKHAPV